MRKILPRPREDIFNKYLVDNSQINIYWNLEKFRIFFSQCIKDLISTSGGKVNSIKFCVLFVKKIWYQQLAPN